MTTYSLKTKFQALLRPTAYKLDHLGITPNQVTIATCVLTFLFSAAIVYFQAYFWTFFLFPVFFFFRMALNAIDGIIAKEKNQITKLGALLNELCDVLSDFFLIAVFFFTSTVSHNLLWGFIYICLLVDCSSLWSSYISDQRSFAGPMGKSDRGIVLTLMAFVVGYKVLTGTDSTRSLEIILYVSIVLSALTVLNRIRYALKGLR